MRALDKHNINIHGIGNHLFPFEKANVERKVSTVHAP